MKKRLLHLMALLLILFMLPRSVLAQNYSFNLSQESVDVYINQDGTLSLDYLFVFANEPGASPIDFVDMGLPNANFDVNSISANVNGSPVAYVSADEYQGSGSGVAVALGGRAIQPGQTGQVRVYVGAVRGALRPDTQGDNYASLVFSPTWFDSEFVHGTTNLSVTFHFPPGVQPDEPRWHQAPSGWSPEPQTGVDDQGRIIYTWSNASASGLQQYKFGASFPDQYVPSSAIHQPGLLEMLGISGEDLIGFTFCCGFGVFFLLMIVFSVRRTRQRKLQYLPPKISIEGHGIKRGLTAIEAAILMEQPMDKILTMILFATVKKGAAQVTSREPLDIEVSDSPPENLRPYEAQFLEAFQISNKAKRRDKLQDMMIDLVRSVSKKMKGFSRKETLVYYKDIVKRAWSQVETADTPEVKSEKFDEVMEWTMLDRDYDDRTRRVFGGGPVFVPIWWPRYDPTYSRGAGGRTISAPTGAGGGNISLPHLPGSDFAASMVTGVQAFSSNVIGNLTDFTSKVTNKTNPVPVSTSKGSSFRGGGGCACACACAGCACACAGGGR
jgi:hypothetical protein